VEAVEVMELVGVLGVVAVVVWAAKEVVSIISSRIPMDLFIFMLLAFRYLLLAGRCRMPDTGCRMPDADMRCGISDAGCRMPVCRQLISSGQCLVFMTLSFGIPSVFASFSFHPPSPLYITNPPVRLSAC